MNRVPVKVSPEHDICQVCGLLPQVDHEEGVGIQYINTYTIAYISFSFK